MTKVVWGEEGPGGRGIWYGHASQDEKGQRDWRCKVAKIHRESIGPCCRLEFRG